MGSATNARRQKPSADVCRDTVYARFRELQLALRDIHSAEPALIDACASAEKLAAAEIPQLGIARLGSRNTLYKYANQVLADNKDPGGASGWRLLDQLRSRVKAAAKTDKRRRSKDAKLERVKARHGFVSNELEQLQVLMTAQCRAYLWLLKEIAGIAKGDGIEQATRQRLFNLINQHDDLFSSLFRPSVAEDIRPNNVSSIS